MRKSEINRKLKKVNKSIIIFEKKWVVQFESQGNFKKMQIKRCQVDLITLYFWSSSIEN